MIRLGLIGLARENNGHPFSYSSIINGVNLEKFPKDDWGVIYDYLKTKHFSDMGINTAKVTHVWTQSKEISNILSETCYIDNIVNDYCDMINKVDAIIIARDDENNHLQMAKPFLESGLKVFIDKPLTIDIEELEYFSSFLLAGQLMSCSGMRYCSELDPLRVDNNIGKINLITGTVINDWEHYGIHLLEAVIGAISFKPISVWSHFNPTMTMIISTNLDFKIIINTLDNSSFTFDINIFGSINNFNVTTRDNFTAFKRTLNSFVRLVNDNIMPYDPKQTIDLMKILIAGKISVKEDREVFMSELHI